MAGVGFGPLAGCLGGREEAESEQSVGESEGTSATDLPTAETRLHLAHDPESLRDNTVNGGASKHGIPSIDSPQFVAADAADFLDPGDPVFGVARDGEAKAYPQKILVHRESANDALAGTPVAVTYGTLARTVQDFGRGDTTFGVSGQ
jgi:hypothetical protein